MSIFNFRMFQQAHVVLNRFQKFGEFRWEEVDEDEIYTFECLTTDGN